MSRALEGRATGQEAFALLVMLLSTHFDSAVSGAIYAKLNSFTVFNGTNLCDFSWGFRVVGSVATGVERVLAHSDRSPLGA